MLPTEHAQNVLTAAGTATAVAAVGVAEPLVPVLGVPLAVLLAACAGALIGLGHSHPKMPAWATAKATDAEWVRGLRIFGRIFALAAGLTFVAVLAAWAVAIVPHVPGFGWAKTVPQLPAAGMLAAGGQFLFPALLERGLKWIRGEQKERSA